MEIVVDTNVFIDAFFHEDEYAQEVLRLEHKGYFGLLFTIPTLDELTYVFWLHALKGVDISNLDVSNAETELKKFLEEFIDPFLKLNRALVRARVVPSKRHKEVCIDPEDDKFINCAIEGCARYIITSDNHLIQIKEPIYDLNKKQIFIKRPYEFVTELMAQTINSRRL